MAAEAPVIDGPHRSPNGTYRCYTMSFFNIGEPDQVCNCLRANTKHAVAYCDQLGSKHPLHMQVVRNVRNVGDVLSHVHASPYCPARPVPLVAVDAREYEELRRRAGTPVEV